MGISYFQCGSQKFAAILFYRMQEYEYDHVEYEYYMVIESEKGTANNFLRNTYWCTSNYRKKGILEVHLKDCLLLLFSAVVMVVLDVAIFKSNLERISKHANSL